MPSARDADDANVRVLLGDWLRQVGRRKRVAFAPQEHSRHLQRLPTLAEDHTTPEPTQIDRAPHEAEDAAVVPAHMRNIRIEQRVIEGLWMHHEDLAPELADAFARWVGQQESAKRLPDER